MPRKIYDHWFGDLNFQNIDEVAAFLQEFLSRSRFTWIFRRMERVDDRLQVHTSLSLYPKVPVAVTKYTESQSIMLHTTYGVHMYDTQLVTGHAHEADGSKLYKIASYWSFDGNRVTILDRAPCGDLIENTFALEDRYEEQCLAKSTWKLAKELAKDPMQHGRLLQDVCDNLKWAGYPEP